MDGVRRRALERVLMMAGRDRLLCVLFGTEAAGAGNRIVEPYKLYNGPEGARLLHCYQVAGAEDAGWRSLPLAEVERILPLEVAFTPRGEYAIYADAPAETGETGAVEDAPRLRLVR